jgi:tetratricopeptide (TPR) repeat protein
VADSPVAPDNEKTANLKNAMELSSVAKQYDKAVPYAKKLDAMTPPPDPATAAAIAETYYFGGDFADAKAAAQKLVDADVKAGKTPSRQALQILMSAEVGLKDDAGAQATLEQQVKYYNDPNDWAQMIDVAITSPGIRDVDAIWLGRLLFATGAKVTPDDANMIGGIAGHLTFFGDAVNAKTHGGTVDPDPVPRAEADKKTLPQQIAAIPAQNGTYSAKLAEALYSYGMFPEAEAAATASIAKGGNAQDPSEAQMVLGQAQAMEGKYDDAIASFGKVTGGSPATARIVRLWTDYAMLKKNPPAPPATAAASAAK